MSYKNEMKRLCLVLLQKQIQTLKVYRRYRKFDRSEISRRSYFLGNFIAELLPHIVKTNTATGLRVGH